jgi:hypothetical protein
MNPDNYNYLEFIVNIKIFYNFGYRNYLWQEFCIYI